MTGKLQQIIALAGYGNHYLINGVLPAGFDNDNSAFRFCNTVDFREVEKQGAGAPPLTVLVARNPSGWFDYLKQGGCRRLRLFYRPSDDNGIAQDHQLAAFVGGGGDWYIEAVYNGYSSYWADRWEVTRQSDPDNKIWGVHYGRAVAKGPISNIQADNDKVKGMLRQTLTQIAAFAFKEKQGSWHELFERSLEIISNEAPEEHYHTKDFLPFENYKLIARQILLSASSAWVFGGMGSWNDLWFEDTESQKNYDRLSAQLYSDINMAIIAAVNTY